MLGDYEVMAFVGTTDPERAKAFYGGVLGLKLVEDAWWAIIYDVGGETPSYREGARKIHAGALHGAGLEGSRPKDDRREAREKGRPVRANPGTATR